MSRPPAEPDPSACPFCRVARGEAEASLVLEDEHTLAFLDHRPLFPGHCLLIPRAHHPTLLELPAHRVGPFFAQAIRLASAVERALDAHGSFVAVNNRVSQSVPHLHLHVVPRRRKDGLRGFFWPRTRYASDAERERVQAAIRAALADLPAG